MTLKNAAIQQMIKLVTEHPTLPVIPVVDEGVVIGEDEERLPSWLGQFGESRLGKYILEDGKLYIYDETNQDEMLNALMDFAWVDMAEWAGDDEAWLNKYRDLNWIDCIFVNVDVWGS